MKRKKENPPKRSYAEVMKDFQKAETQYEYRVIHKEMKKSGYGSVPIWLRYPDLPFQISLFALGFVVATLIFTILIRTEII